MMVLNAEPTGYSEKAIKLWEQKGYEYKASAWNEIDNAAYFENVSVLIVRLARKIDDAILEKFPVLQFIVSATTGLDHIDQAALSSKNIRLISLRGEDEFLKTIPSTAEHTWALLLSLIRNIPAANEDVKNGYWNRDKFRGYQLKDKMLGIIGLGRTGKKIATYAKAFSMQVQYVDPNVNEVAYHKCASLNELFASSDIISLHVHLTAETTKLIDQHNIESIKPGALFINTSRGKIVDEQSLVDALVSNKLQGIATDVLETELENISHSPLWKAQQKHANIIITPHIGGATNDAMWACEEYLAGKEF